MTQPTQLTTPPDTTITATMPPPRTATLSPHLLSNIFTSLSRDTRQWSLLRNLKSDNPLEINGELRGTASFTPLYRPNTDRDREMVYREEGELPNTLGLGVGMAGLRWTKKYIWRQQSGNGRISVWFVKVDKSAEDEADYLFHDFDFDTKTESDTETEDADASTFVTPPVPPAVMGQDTTTVVIARGNHLCINDMYRTAYAFRIRPESGEVLSWSSRHVVKGPKKNQDIVNLYRMEG